MERRRTRGQAPIITVEYSDKDESPSSPGKKLLHCKCRRCSRKFRQMFVTKPRSFCSACVEWKKQNFKEYIRKWRTELKKQENETQSRMQVTLPRVFE